MSSLGELKACIGLLRKALARLADAAETMAGSDPDMPSHVETEQEFDAALDAARHALDATKE